MANYNIYVNGQFRTVEVAPTTSILWVLQDSLGLVDTKYGCGIAQNGACMVYINDDAIRSCVTPISSVLDKRLRR